MEKRISYKTAVLDYLKEHKNKDVRRDTLMAETSVSKSRLTEVLQSIRNDGYTIISPNRSGIVRLEIDEESISMPISDIKDQDIRKWFIIFLLTKYETLTFREIVYHLMTLKDKAFEQIKLLKTYDGQKKAYDNNALIQNIRDNYSTEYDEFNVNVAEEIISVTAIRTDLNNLQDENIVKMINVLKPDTGRYQTKYILTDQAPSLVLMAEDSLFEFCQEYEQQISTLSAAKPLKQAYSRMKALVNYDGNTVEQYHFGKENNISQDQINALNNYASHNYKTHILQLKTLYKDEETLTDFATGLLFYSTETSGLYALGRNIQNGYILSLRLERILDINELSEQNHEFHDQSYYDIFDEMLASQYEPIVSHVKVLVNDFGNVVNRFNDLTDFRKHASMRKLEKIPKGCEYKSAYIYEDNIRGIADFARFLRKFGNSVVALEPIELKERMLNTYKRIIEMNEE